MQKLKVVSLEELLLANPCQEAMDFVKLNNNSIKQAWDNCENPKWMLWYLFYVVKCEHAIFNKISLAFDKLAKENLSADAGVGAFAAALADADAEANALADARVLAYARALARAHAYANARTYAYANARIYVCANAYVQLAQIIRTIIN